MMSRFSIDQLKILVVTLLCGTAVGLLDPEVSKEKVLIKKLLDRYKEYGVVGRPVNNTLDRINVEFGLSLIQIMDVDEKNQVLETNVWYTYKWTDVLLRWNKEDYENITKIMVPPEDVWIPDIVLYNFADSRLVEQRRALVNVYNDGSIVWMPQAILRSTCGFDTRYFPFDTQKCHLKFGSWTHDGSKLDLQFYDGVERFMVDDYVKSNEWVILENVGVRNVKIYECCKDTPYLDLKFYITMKRLTAFYSFILLMPCALLSCLTLTLFWVPPESPAKLVLDDRLNEQRQALVVVSYTGDIIWMPQAILRSTCNFDTKYFPFDTQECYLKFGSWTHDGTYLDLQFFDGIERFMIEDYVPGNEWTILNNTGKRHVKIYECCKDVPYLDLKFYLTIERKVAFYSFILMLPCALLSCLTLVIFWVPPDSPAKLILGMNIFVAFFVLLLLLAESTPKAADSIPLIGAYFCLSMVMITMSTVLATIIVNMFFRGVRINRAPKWLRTMMIDCVARALFLHEQLVDKDANKPQKKNNTWRNRNMSDCKYSDPEMKFAKVRLLDNGKDERVTISTSSEVLEQNCVNEIPDDRFGFGVKSSSLVEDIHAIREILEDYKAKKAKQELREKCIREWKIICCVTDRLFFVCYVIINIAGIITIFFGKIV